MAANGYFLHWSSAAPAAFRGCCGVLSRIAFCSPGIRFDELPARLGRPFYAVATAHAAVGCIAELLGIYIVLAAGTNILPGKLRLVSYKHWMRTALVIWWLELILGVTTYARWYPL